MSDNELADIVEYIIITHITNGNYNEERLVKILGGTVIETESEKLIRQGFNLGKIQMIIEMGQEDGLDDTAILKKLQDKIGVSIEKAVSYLKEYGKQPV